MDPEIIGLLKTVVYDLTIILYILSFLRTFYVVGELLKLKG